MRMSLIGYSITCNVKVAWMIFKTNHQLITNTILFNILSSKKEIRKI